MSDEPDALNTVELATELTIAWLGNHNNRVSAGDVPAFLAKMHETLNALGGGNAAPAVGEEASSFTPAISVRKSLASPDHIISMIDGKPYKTLRRHLSANGLTPDEYRQRYGLKADYPMVSESYSTSRREMAHKIGLGRKSRTASESAASTKEGAPSSSPNKPARGRSKKAAADT